MWNYGIYIIYYIKIYIEKMYKNKKQKIRYLQMLGKFTCLNGQIDVDL